MKDPVNIVLIGMPTAGKTTISRLVGKELGRPVTEMDDEIELRAGKTIRRIFAEDGEDVFRKMETEIAAELKETSGRIISCGGGVVKIPETMKYLQECGLIVWLKRDLGKLYPTGTRPLAADRGSLEKLYWERQALYAKYSDVSVDNNGTMEKTVAQIVALAECDPGALRERKQVRKIRRKDFSLASIRLPSSKSAVHRAVILSAFANGESVIRGDSGGEDVEATIRAVRALGASVTRYDSTLIVKGVSRPAYNGSVIDCGESGSTLRFLIPVAALLDEPVTFSISGRLPERPMEEYEELFAKHSLRFERDGNLIRVCGPLQAGEYEISGRQSSQFLSGMMMALSLLEDDSRIRIIPPLNSEPYAAMTAKMINAADGWIEREENTVYVRGGGFAAGEKNIPGDDSLAAFAAMIPYVTGRPVRIMNMSHDSLQADHTLVDAVRRMGGTAEEMEDGYIFLPARLRGADIDLRNCPDLGPALIALASQAEGTSVFSGTDRLRFKESDRVEAMAEEMTKLGCLITAGTDTVCVRGKTPVRSGMTLSPHHDHRVAMALSILALAADGTTALLDPGCVRKSWPEFFGMLEQAGIIQPD